MTRVAVQVAAVATYPQPAPRTAPTTLLLSHAPQMTNAPTDISVTPTMVERVAVLTRMWVMGHVPIQVLLQRETFWTY